jgi:exodeoxyribonuclease V alpha subunit
MKIEGPIKNIRFSQKNINEISFFIIFQLYEYTIKGNIDCNPSIGDYVIVEGDTKYNEQYNNYEINAKIKISLPKDKKYQEIRLKHIYQNLLDDEYIKKICGDDLWHNLDNKLLNIDDYIYKIYNDYLDDRFGCNRKVLNFLNDNNIKLNKNQIDNLILYYENNSEIIIKTIKENLIELLEIDSFGIKCIQKIAESLEYTKEQLLELEIILYLYQPYNNNGSTCMFYNNLLDNLDNIDTNKKIDKQIKKDYIEKLINEDKIIKYNEYLYYKEHYNCELNIAESLVQIKNNNIILEEYQNDINEFISKIGFNTEQKQGIINLFSNNVNIICGAAGTGKSFILTNLIKFINNYDDIGCLFLTPTGKASDRLNKDHNFKDLDIKSYTIHKYLFYNPEPNPIKEFDDLLNNKIKIFIIDEVSMIGIDIFNRFINKIKQYENIVLLFIGDPNQLPSIACGDVLNHLIKSKCFSVTKLNKIQRTDLQGLLNAQTNILNKILPENSDSFIWNPDLTLDDYIKDFNELPLILTSTNKLIKKYEDKVKNIFNISYNEKNNIQIFNKEYHVDDFIMIIRNNYEKQLVNGMIGQIKEIKNKSIIVKFDDEIKEITDLNDIKMSYLLTIHKAQGIENDNVIVIIDKDSKMNSINLLYTAITRAKKQCILIAKTDTIKNILINKNNKRISNLKYLIRK